MVPVTLRGSTKVKPVLVTLAAVPPLTNRLGMIDTTGTTPVAYAVANVTLCVYLPASAPVPAARVEVLTATLPLCRG